MYKDTHIRMPWVLYFELLYRARKYHLSFSAYVRILLLLALEEE